MIRILELIAAVAFTTILASRLQPWDWATNLWWFGTSEGRIELATMLVAYGWVLRSALRLR